VRVFSYSASSKFQFSLYFSLVEDIFFPLFLFLIPQYHFYFIKVQSSVFIASSTYELLPGTSEYSITYFSHINWRYYCDYKKLPQTSNDIFGLCSLEVC